jgi:SPP1 family phage portal protein
MHSGRITKSRSRYFSTAKFWGCKLELTIEQILKIWQAGHDQREAMRKRENYYYGDHAILKRDEYYANGQKKTNRVTNFIQFAIDLFVGALTSAPFQVTPAGGVDEEKVDTYEVVYDANNLRSIDTENLRRCMVHGWAVEVHEIVDKEITIWGDSALNWQPVYDSFGDLVGAIYYRVLPAGTIFEDGVLQDELEWITYYSDSVITDYQRKGSGGAWVRVGEQAHGFGRVPVVIWTLNNQYRSIISDSVMALNDEYNDIDSASGDDIRNDTNAILLVKGYDAASIEQEAAKIKELGIIPLGEGGDASYITKNNDVARVESRLRRVREGIFIGLSVPDFETIIGATGSTSGIALQLKFFPMQSRSSAFVNWIKKSIQGRIDLINSVARKKGLAVLDDYQITVQFVIPANRVEQWKAIKTLEGVVSLRKRLELLDDVDDPEQEIKRMETEGVLAGELQGEAAEIARELDLQRATREFEQRLET